MPALLKRAGELGLLMIDIPEAYGGLGLHKTTSMLVSERGALCASFSVSWGAHTGIGTLPLVYYGTEAQKQQLPAEARDRRVARRLRAHRAAARAATRSRAQHGAVLEPDGTHYRLTGTKQFITNAGFADLFTVFAKVDGEKFTAFLVERDDARRLDRDRRSTSSASAARRRASSSSRTSPVPADARARRDRPGPQDRVQHPEHRPLQARRRRGRRRQGVPRASRSTTRATGSSSASRSRASA